jgi:hypothetical protein
MVDGGERPSFVDGVRFGRGWMRSAQSIVSPVGDAVDPNSAAVAVPSNCPRVIRTGCSE